MDNSNSGMTTLIDGDIVAYRCAAHRPYILNKSGEPYKGPSGKFVKRDASLEECLAKVDETIEEILEETSFYNRSRNFKVYLTGSGNFRYDIAKTHVYKGNRSGAEKPYFLPKVRECLIDKYSAQVSNGEEADDLISIEATALGVNAIIASIDKDFLQIPGLHYNLTSKKFTNIDHLTAMKNFYKQVLTGDTADNIVGLYRVGPVTAEGMVADCKKEEDLWNVVVDAYGGDIARIVENARLLWLRRVEGELWNPPVPVAKRYLDV